MLTRTTPFFVLRAERPVPLVCAAWCCNAPQSLCLWSLTAHWPRSRPPNQPPHTTNRHIRFFLRFTCGPWHRHHLLRMRQATRICVRAHRSSMLRAIGSCCVRRTVFCVDRAFLALRRLSSMRSTCRRASCSDDILPSSFMCVECTCPCLFLLDVSANLTRCFMQWTWLSECTMPLR